MNLRKNLDTTDRRDGRQEILFHLGYEFDENDAHDVKLLCETLHIEIPNEYR